jgi:hypothetical protein
MALVMTEVVVRKGDLSRAERDALIVRLRRAGAGYRDIATVVGVGKSQVQRVFHTITEEATMQYRERNRLADDLQETADALRSTLFDGESPPTIEELAGFVRLMKAQMLLFGLGTPDPVLCELGSRHQRVAGVTDKGQRRYDRHRRG